MATASPTPMGAGSHFTSLGRRTSARQALRRPNSRQQMSRSESNPGPVSAAAATKEPKTQSQQYPSLNDSSDDEIPVPMKLSALTKALLNDGHASEASSIPPSAPDERPSLPQRPTSRVKTRRNAPPASTSSATEEKQTRERETRRHTRAGSAQLPSSRPTSPARSGGSSPAPRKRVVRLSTTGTTPAGGSLNPRLRQSLSASASTQPRRRAESKDRTDERYQQPPQEPQPPQATGREPGSLSDINTPLPPVRTVRIAVGSSGNKGRSGGSSGTSSKRLGTYSDQEMPDDPAASGQVPPAACQGSVSRYGGAARKDEPGPQSSLRVKRVTKLPGSFLSGPARRGKRRQSEEDAEDLGDGEALGSSLERRSQRKQTVGEDDAADQPASSFLASNLRDFAATGSPVSAKDAGRVASRKDSLNANMPDVKIPNFEKDHPVEPPARRDPAPPPGLVSANNKENEIPLSSYKRNKPLSSILIEPDLNKPVQPSSAGRGGAQPQARSSPERKALALKSHNTPHRPAPPPPPKMSVVDTATKSAGAAATSQASKKRAVLLRVNDRVYTRIECVGRGGSGKVYRVSAENGSMYALKRVSIENADETTVKGFKGEIDLLKRLTGVDRVIQLYDWELNEEKQMLSLLMEMGELDLNTLLKSRLGQEGHKLDLVFVKFFWKEMLECLATVHAKDIVHSDLKPANFVLVKGRLKLIDFGIANAIRTDETINIHRENQVGTPNFMSPESLMDSSQYAFTVANNGRFCVPPPLQHHKKLMKLGKPSDVWSLGCMLYQMVYGDLPFAHIPNQMARCQAIINWNHAINFPEKVGDVRVPLSLIRTMKRCLNREQRERPTCEELLSSSDPFLYPQEFDPEVFGLGGAKGLPITEELLGRIIQSVVQRCKERLPTDGEAMSAWPMAYWASIKKTVGARDLKY